MLCLVSYFYTHAQLLLCNQAVISSSVCSKTAISLISSFSACCYHLFTALTPFKMIYALSTVLFIYLFIPMSLISNCLYMGAPPKHLTARWGGGGVLLKWPGLSETSLHWDGRGCSLLPKKNHVTLCMWGCACDAVCCHGHSAMNVSNHIKIKCVLKV